MAPPFFIAVQCCQCSTMQVKQQKKSSNKWTCVVCNQKQSVRRVFAQGPVAKDLRLFVQSFNMSRMFADSPVTLAPQDGGEIAEEASDRISGGRDSRKQKRIDWSEYLEMEHATCAEECDEDIKILTELPKEMFKKPKLKDDSSQLSKRAEYGKLYRPAFSKRHTLKSTPSPDIEPRRATKGHLDAVDKVIEPDGPRFATATRASKWDHYFIEDDNDLRLELGSKKNLSDEMSQTVTTSARRVEDEIHPDFM